MIGWLSRIWKGTRPNDQSAWTIPVMLRDQDTELAELVALIESGDTSEAGLERMAELLAQTDPNKNRF